LINNNNNNKRQFKHLLLPLP